MSVVVAILRGINVGGHRKIRMAELTALWRDTGYPDARTYLQSGNVVFDAGRTAPATLEKQLAAAIEGQFGVEVTVLVRTAGDVAEVLANNPFLTGPDGDPGTDPKTLHVTFLQTAPVNTDVLDASPPDRVVVVGRHGYIHCPNGYGRTRFNNNYLERRLGVAATTRNWKTVTALAGMTTGHG